MRKLSAADPVLNGAFGQSVSLYGHLLLTGAKGATGAAIGSGAAYLHDVRTGGELGKLFTVDGLFGQEFGSGVSLSGNLGLIGAQSGNGNSTGTGAAYLFDVSRRVELAKWIAPDGQGGDRYGVSVALCGGSALIGAHLDDDQANNSGAAYYYRNISGPLQLTSKAKSGDFAPGIIGADFVSFANVYLNDQDELAFAGALTNKMKGVWGTYAGTLAPIGKPGEDVSTLNPGYGTGTTIGSAFAPIPEHGENAIFRIIAKGPNQKGSNSGAILQNGDAGFVPMLKMNDVAPIGDGAFQSFPDMVQNASNGNVIASYTLRKGAFGVTSSNDTGVAALDKTGNLLVNGIIPVGSRYREGESASSLTSGGGDKLGQLFGRVATGDGAYFYFPSYVIPGAGGTAIQGLFFSSATGSTGNAAVQGDPGVAVPNTLFRSFLGETVKGSYAVYRATLVGDVGQVAVPSSRDEGLFSERGFLAFREGFLPGNINAIPQASDVVVNRILGYWGLDGGDTVVALLQLRGPGVTSANDGALYLAKHDGFRQQLFREGDVVGDCDCPRIGIIQRVDVDTVAGNYIVLASLTGSKARNQAILTGKLSLG
ncbi:MAG: hypothetical protein KDM64_14620, partial [Verrucomicrobiae bacterium]|nr:hypothetical protein [Verrucomicrobiae bacterium]